MFDLFLCCALLSGPSAADSTLRPTVPGPPALEQRAAQDERRAEFDEKRAAAKGDKEALWEVHKWCEAFGLEREAQTILKDILRVDENDRAAHEGLGHIEYDGQWFTTEKKLESYKKKQAKEERKRLEAEAEEKGWVEWEDTWVDPADIPFLERGLTRAEDGSWVSAEELQRVADGWVRQDLTWVSPDEISKMDEGLWKVGDEWMSLEDANAARAEIGAWWQIPTDSGMLVTSTVDRETTLEAVKHMDRALQELRRFFGVDPQGTIHVVLLRTLEQYNELAGNADFMGLSSATYACLADAYVTTSNEWIPAGVGYWDASSEAGAAFGIHSARHAAGMGFVEALDPSPKAIAAYAKATKGKPDLEKLDGNAFYEEKRLPPVLRQGLGVYAGRFFIDRTVAAGGDALWARKWSLSNLASQGGLRDAGTVLRFAFQGEEGLAEDTSQLMLEAGALVAFILDGENAAVTEAHTAWKEAWQAGGDIAKPTEELLGAVADEWAAFQAFLEG